ncbi:Xaa-Pro peptidase family protein [Aquibacillus sp. 3ASR75-11]|uniref:Xaa-Pro peptidase family protein n=1 Tax=Terrihalobacillus insolitus TaxID=2950438 RepID=A0A9X4APV1_9BACI|nr:Xaa-Pro peptidase family protein [Terrihalobacillus insolitus]MDC3413780.1 Xaa-Pro peptidase family protein [Terrihalobacillus insolitus]MDC3425948.1 Xaa-Pro peptidase family protein [Terrihalobacillus insolitus]
MNRLSNYLQEQQISVAFVTSTANVFYLTGFYCVPHERLLGLLVFPNQEPILVCPKMETNTARNSGWKYGIVDFSDTDNPWELIQKKLDQTNLSFKKMAVEENHLILSRYYNLKDLFQEAKIENIEPELQQMRLTKDESEIEIMREAARLADLGIEAGVKAVAVGVTELEVLSSIESEMKKNGVHKFSFDPIVLFGQKSADPHGVPGNQKLKKGNFVLFDIGVHYNGYCSDITRTFIFGEASQEQKEIYQTVLNAELAAINHCNVGNKVGELDTISRNYIEDKGYGPYFIHRLGHGLGIEVHEFPSLNNQNNQPLVEGMAFTIEPGIYIPEIGGVRIEDDIVITKDGVEVLTSYPKELQIIKEQVKI